MQKKRTSATKKKKTSTKSVKNQNPIAYGMSKQPTSKTSSPSTAKKTGKPTTKKTAPKSQKGKKRKKRRLRIGRVLFLLIIAIGLGYIAIWTARTGIPLLIKRLQKDWLQINSAPIAFSKKAYQRLDQTLQNDVNQYVGQGLSIAGQDLVTGVSFGIASHHTVNAASWIALPVTMTLYNDIIQGTVSEKAIVKLTAADRQAGPGYLSGMPIGSSYTVTQLAKAAIVQHDTTAINMLIRYLGRGQITTFMNTMGSQETMQRPYLTTSYDMTLFYSYLYSMDQAHPAQMGSLMQDLALADPLIRLSSVKRPTINVVHTISNWPFEFYDAGILTVDHHPIAIAISTTHATILQANAEERTIAAQLVAFAQKGY